MLCEKCNKRVATIHITELISGAGGGSKKTDLCSECSESLGAPDAAREMAAVWKNARCRYCGGLPCGGGVDPIARLSGISKMRWMCGPCAEEYHRFLRHRWPGFGEITITDEQIAKIHTADISVVLGEAEEHMKKWVAEQNSR